MTSNPIPEALASCLRFSVGAGRGLRQAAGLRWLGSRAAYPAGVIVLSTLSLGTVLLTARLLGPAAFGTFTLLATLFQLASKADLGLSQLADQRLAAGTESEPDCTLDILRARLVIGTTIVAVMLPVAMIVGSAADGLSALDIALASAGGAAFMIANGPVTVFRARSGIWEFTVAALVLQAGLTAPRLAGLLLGGVTGIFLALVLWYGLLAAVLSSVFDWRAERTTPLSSLVVSALPLFAFNGFWEIYLSANRWISAGLSPAEDFGLFAFGANLAFAGIVMIGSVAQVRYPKLLGQIARSARGACSDLVEREASRLSLLLSVCIAAAIPATAPMIQLIFPQYEAASALTRAFAVSCVPLGFVACALPIVIPLAVRPWSTAITIFGPALVVLAGAMVVAEHMAGVEGQAWACTIAGLVMVFGIVASMHRLGIVGTPSALRIGLVQAVAVTGLAILAFACAPSGRVGAEKAFSPSDKTILSWESTRAFGAGERLLPPSIEPM